MKDLLLAAGSLATELTGVLATPGVDSTMFSSLLRFLYTGEYPSQNMSPQQIDLLISLGRECGVPNLLEVRALYFATWRKDKFGILRAFKMRIVSVPGSDYFYFFQF